MKLRREEIEFLAAWAREEKQPDPYGMPAHRLQAAHDIRGVALIRLIKAWARSEGRRDEEIFEVGVARQPDWPWTSTEDLTSKLVEAEAQQAV